MKKEIEVSARTKEEAIAQAVAELGAPGESALVITVVREARKGFLGFGAVDAVIHAAYQVPDEPAVSAGEDGDAEAAVRPAREPRSDKPRRPRGDRRGRPARAPRQEGETEETPEAPSEATPETPVRPRPEPIDPETATASEQTAYRFICKLVEDMGLSDVTVAMHPGTNDDMVITVDGKEAGVLIGHHGDTLDALQYLANLAANRKEEGEKREYARITVDVEDYRAKREDTLVRLANRMANRAVKTGRRVSLEPMNPYERRIIHSALQPNENVDTHSEGEEPNRHVVITLRK